MTDRIDPVVNGKTEAWKCVSCFFMLGYVEDKKVVRMKRKDHFVMVEGGKITIICPRCGRPNVLEDSNNEERR